MGEGVRNTQNLVYLCIKWKIDDGLKMLISYYLWLTDIQATWKRSIHSCWCIAQSDKPLGIWFIICFINIHSLIYREKYLNSNLCTEYEHLSKDHGYFDIAYLLPCLHCANDCINVFDSELIYYNEIKSNYHLTAVLFNSPGIQVIRQEICWQLLTITTMLTVNQLPMRREILGNLSIKTLSAWNKGTTVTYLIKT